MRRVSLSNNGSILRQISLNTTASCPRVLAGTRLGLPGVIASSSARARQLHNVSTPFTIGSSSRTYALRYQRYYSTPLTTLSPPLSYNHVAGSKRPPFHTGSPFSALLQPNLILVPRARIRQFHSTSPRHDVFFLAFPALKAHLLNLTRICLIALPFVYRYRLWKKYPRTSLAFLNIPIFALCIVIALALDQSPRTQRWRLLLMTGREELEWARRRFDDFLRSDGPLLLKEDDPRVQQVQKVTQRIVCAIEEPDQERRIVSAAHKIWPPPESVSSSGADMQMQLLAKESEHIRIEYPPSARAVGSVVEMPFVPESSNPNKVFESTDWKLYVVDLPRIDAFALPTREIVVYTGLIDLLEDDTLLSAVLAHEISHVVQRHAVENAGFMNVATIAFDILRGISFAFTMSFPMVSDAAASVFNVMNDYLAQRAFSRKLEEEADSLGMEFMASAGYDPRGAIDLWEVMALVEEDAAASGQAVSIQDRMTLLRTHPTSIQRQKNLTKLLPKAMELYRQSPLRTKKLEDEKPSSTVSAEPAASSEAVGANPKQGVEASGQAGDVSVSTSSATSS